MTALNSLIADNVAAIFAAVIGGLVGAFITYWFSLRHDRVARRRERINNQLEDVYMALEGYAQRDRQTPERTAAVEKAMATVFLLGDAKAIALAKDLNHNVKSGMGFDVAPLALYIRQKLRDELALQKAPDDNIIHFRGSS